MPQDQSPPTQPTLQPEKDPTQQQRPQPSQNLPPQSETSPPKKPNKLIIAIVVFIAITILINIPIPSYVSGNKANCLFIENCPKAGLSFGPSLVQRVLKRSPSGQSIEDSSITTPTPPLSQTPQTENNLTANWKTFTSDKFNYSFKHPNLKINPCNAGGLTNDDILDVVVGKGQQSTMHSCGDDYSIAVFVDVKSNYTAINDKIESYKSYVFDVLGEKTREITKSSTNINDYPATKVTMLPNQYAILFASKPEGPLITIIVQSETNLIETDQILSTFRFTSDTSNWKTYRNEEYGFEFKYPKRFKKLEEYENSRYTPDSYFSTGIIKSSKPLKEYLRESDELAKTGFEGKPSSSIYTSKNIHVLNKPAIQREVFLEAAGFYAIETYIELATNTFLHFQMNDQTGSKELDNSLRELNNQILSTFKFIE